MKLSSKNIAEYWDRNKKIIIPIIIFIVLLIIMIIVIRKTRNRQISFAKRLIGNEETSGNQGFKNPTFENMMRSVGWIPGHEWCAYTMKLVFTNSLSPKHRELAKKLMNGSTQLTLANFENDDSGLFGLSDYPKKGAQVIWRSKKDPSRGHTGLVTKVYSDGGFETIEGNSNKDGSPGKVTTLKYGPGGAPASLKLMKFIYPK